MPPFALQSKQWYNSSKFSSNLWDHNVNARLVVNKVDSISLFTEFASRRKYLNKFTLIKSTRRSITFKTMDAITYCNHKVYVVTSLKRSWLIFDAVLVWIILIEMKQVHSPFYEIQFVMLTSLELFLSKCSTKFTNTVDNSTKSPRWPTYSYQASPVLSLRNLEVPRGMADQTLNTGSIEYINIYYKRR